MKKLRITRHSPAYWRATFDNPPLNLLDPEVATELRELINQMETSKELKVIVFDSADPDFYIGHVDLIRAGEFPTDVGPLDFLKAIKPDQPTGKPDESTLKQFLATHPWTAKVIQICN
jgi:enoyl-CoA hydratase/carnithine racemase